MSELLQTVLKGRFYPSDVCHQGKCQLFSALGRFWEEFDQLKCSNLFKNFFGRQSLFVFFCQRKILISWRFMHKSQFAEIQV